MKKSLPELKKAFITSLIIIITVAVTTFIQTLSLSVSLILMLFVLSVFIISLVTKEFLWGIIASLISVLVVNYAFTEPYYYFNFSLSDNLFSAVVILTVAITTGIMTVRIKNLEEMKEIADTKPGFIRAMWCGDRECEDKLKEVAGVTSRCIPFEQEEITDTCVCCGKKAKAMLYWGKAY